MQLTGGCSR